MHSDRIFIGRSSVHNSADLAAAQHEDPISQLQQHIQILSDKDNRRSLSPSAR